jgi:hypothetical protein
MSLKGELSTNGLDGSESISGSPRRVVSGAVVRATRDTEETISTGSKGAPWVFNGTGR